MSQVGSISTDFAVQVLCCGRGPAIPTLGSGSNQRRIRLLGLREVPALGDSKGSGEARWKKVTPSPYRCQ